MPKQDCHYAVVRNKFTNTTLANGEVLTVWKQWREMPICCGCNSHIHRIYVSKPKLFEVVLATLAKPTAHRSSAISCEIHIKGQ